MEKEKECGFTLIELLGVLTVMAVIMAITIASFKGLGQSAKMRSSVNNLKSTLSLARQWAITHRENTSVVFTDSGDHAYKGYAVYCGTNQVADWKDLSEGIFFNHTVVPGAGINPFLAGKTTFTNQEGNVDAFYDVTYKPTGDPASGFGSNEQQLYLMEGIQAQAGAAPLPAADSVMKVVVIKPFTGLIKVEDDGAAL